MVILTPSNRHVWWRQALRGGVVSCPAPSKHTTIFPVEGVIESLLGCGGLICGPCFGPHVCLALSSPERVPMALHRSHTFEAGSAAQRRASWP